MALIGPARIGVGAAEQPDLHIVGRRSTSSTPRPGGIGVPGRTGGLTPVVWKNSTGSSGWRCSARRALRISLSIGFMENPPRLRLSIVAMTRR
ncbi:hypothetical protein WB334_25905, partial [Escherichia coli]|uniref:hypothetical protein n=1 Tax=Escherichia coli TaxID=562 RepID=UPI00215846F8